MPHTIDLTDSLEKIPVKIFPSPKDGSVYVANIIATLIKEKNGTGKKCGGKWKGLSK